MDPLDAKIVAIVVLAVVSLILGLIPLKVAKILDNEGFWQRTTISALLQFGGGVLFSTCFVHIFPEVIEWIENSGVDLKGAPLGEISFCFGFLLIYFVEEMVHNFCDSKVHGQQQETVHRAFSIHSQSCEIISHEEDNIPLKKADMAQHYSHMSMVTSENTVNSSTVRDFLTILALSFHSVFEGMAIGLEEQTDEVWKLFTAVATHKFVICFCVGMELMSSKTRTPLFILYMITFSVMTPLGIGIGAALNAAKAEDQAYILATAILQGIAAGTILYVVVFEILEKGRSKKVSGLFQFVFFVIGFAVMMCIDMFV